MFDDEILNSIVFDSDGSSDIYALLKLAEINELDIYICAMSLVKICMNIDKRKYKTFIGLIDNLLSVCDLRMNDIRKAIGYKDFYSGIMIRQAIRHKLDYIVTNNSEFFNSTIKVASPKEIRKILEDGKTN